MKKLQLLGLLTLLTLPLIYQLTPLEILKLKVFDAWVKEQPTSDVFVTLDITEQDVQQEGGWPFPRQRLAEIHMDLLHRGAMGVGYVIAFSEPDRFGGDEQFANVLGLYPSVIAMFETDNQQYPQTTGTVILGDDIGGVMLKGSTQNIDILKEKAYQVVVNILPMGFVIFLVIGFIVLGWATPSESASFGVVGVVILALVRKALTWNAFKTSLIGTIRVVGMVFFILMNSTVFSQLLSFSGASRGFVGWATGFDVAPLVILGAMFLVLILLGMFMDPVSMMLITVPIFYPIASELGYDLIWFSLIVLMSLEMSATTPPFGLLLYIMMGMVKGTTLGQVSLAAAPYLLCDLILIIILIIF